ncbi:hypothetical protein Prudu_010929 [Prunus dulcis]|uniref:Uncharacterized protein n=1 Tax=Prunus dulcis TaxID=3755 RepID=A0A4Y1R9I7_PRUDU|nr:hypothetical protein Prudu_010929 [Prunus dulcis]
MSIQKNLIYYLPSTHLLKLARLKMRRNKRIVSVRCCRNFTDRLLLERQNVGSSRPMRSSGCKAHLSGSRMANNKKAEDIKPKQPHTASMEIELKLFTGKENFTFWQRHMKHVITQ